MKFRVGFAAVACMVMSVLTLVVPTASAQTCSNLTCVATALKSNPVYQDPAAENKLTEAQQTELRNKIGTREPRVFIALLPLRAADANGGVNEVPAKIGQGLGIPASVGVVAGNNFRARSGGGAQFETNQIAKLATDAFERNHPRNHGGSVMPMLLSFVDAVHNAPQVAPKAAPSAGAGSSQTQFQPAKKKSNTGRNILLFLLFLFIVAAAIGTFVVVRNKRRFQDRKASVSTKVLGLQTAIFQAENGGDFFNTEAKSHLRRAERHWDQADTNLRADDLDEAERDLERGHSALAAATSMANMPEPPPPPPPEPIVVPLNRTKRAPKGQARIKDAQVDPEGRIVINNTVQQPRDRQDDDNGYYFPGGYMGGRYVYGGWYPYDMMTYLMWDSILDDRRDSHGHHHDTGGGKDSGGNEREASTVGGGSWEGGGSSSGGDYEEANSGGGDWGSGTTGGGSWDSDTDSPAPAPEPEPEPVSSGGSWGSSDDDNDRPSYSPPAYDPPSYSPPSYDPPSTGGGDWGGGGGGGGGGDTGGGSW